MNLKAIINSLKTHPIIQIIIGFAILSFVYGVLQKLLSDLFINQGIHTELGVMFATVISALVTIVVYILYFRVSDNRDINELSTHHFIRNIAIGKVLGFGIMSLSILFIYLMGSYKVLKINSLTSLIPAFGIAVGSGIYEELVFRGIIFRLLEKMKGTYFALIVSALIFGFGHIVNPNADWISAIAITIEAGLLLGLAYVWKRNLWIPIALHFMWNFTQAGIYGANVSGFETKSLIESEIVGAKWLTGGAFGPEAAVQTVILCLIVIFILWNYCKKNGQIIPYRKKVKL